MGIAIMIGFLATILTLALSSTSGETALEYQAFHEETQTLTSTACPDKWFDASFMDMGCLSFNNTKAVSWEEAFLICQETPNATLADIQSEVQMGFLQMELDVI